MKPCEKRQHTSKQNVSRKVPILETLRKKKQKQKLRSSRGSKIVNQLVIVLVFLVKPVVWVFHQHTYYSQQPDMVILLL